MTSAPCIFKIYVSYHHQALVTLNMNSGGGQEKGIKPIVTS